MLAADIELIDLDPRHWRYWYELLVPAPLRGRASWALLYVDDARPAVPVAGMVYRKGAPDDAQVQPLDCRRVRRATSEGAVVTSATDVAASVPDDASNEVSVDPSANVSNTVSASAMPVARLSDLGDLGDLGTSALARTARSLAVEAVVIIDLRTTTALYDQVVDAMRIDADFAAQGITALRIMKRYRGHGIWTYPAMLDIIPPVAYEPLQRTFDMLIPDRSSLVGYVFEDDMSDVHASIIAVKRGGHLDLVTTHLGLEDVMSGPEAARGWRQGYRALLGLVKQRYAPASLGVFLERRTFHRIATGPSDQFARELSAGNVVIDPAPAWLLGLLGGATVAAFASRGAKALARMLPSSARRMAAGFAHSAQNAIRDTGAHPFDLLGFDPITLWHDLRHLYQTT